jgi:hypothetical protein
LRLTAWNFAPVARVDSLDSFNFFNFDISDFPRSSPKNSATYDIASLARALLLLRVRAKAMFKISILDTPNYRRLVIEGKLIAPWTSELTAVWQQATADLNGRELVVDVKGLTAVTEDGENVLLELMKEGARFRSGVFTKQVLKRLARRIQSNVQEEKK